MTGRRWRSALVVLVVLSAACGGDDGNEVAEGDVGPAGGTQAAGGEPPRVGDHWHSAFGIYRCDQFENPVLSAGDPFGIHTHDDGLIHVHPFFEEAAGANATLGLFLETVELSASDTELTLPDGTTLADGDACGGEGAGEVRLLVDGEEVAGDPSDLRLAEDQRQIVLAFAPAGAEIPDLPWADAVESPADME